MFRGTRSVLAAAGVAAALSGVVFALAPGLTPFSAGRAAVVALAVVGLLLAGTSVQRRRHADRETASPPSPADRRQFGRPGTEVDGLIDRGFSGTDANAVRDRERLRERLYPIAVGVVMRRENVSRDRAQRLLETGEWTDDRFAARYFAGPSVAIPLPVRVRYRVRGRSLRAVYARRAIDALAAEVVG